MSCTSGDWQAYYPDGVQQIIYEKAGNPDLTLARQMREEGSRLFEDKRSDIISILETALSSLQDAFLIGLKAQLEKKQISTAYDFIETRKPRRPVYQDAIRFIAAEAKGIRLPAHIAVLSEVFSIQNPETVCEELADIAKRAASHLTRAERSRKRSELIGRNVFIGHGRSLLWRELKDFVQERLKLPWDEFNRVPVAGVTNIARLSEMLDAAAIAFLILTGEDEQADGTL